MLLLTLKCLGKIIAVFDFLRCGTAPVKRLRSKQVNVLLALVLRLRKFHEVTNR